MQPSFGMPMREQVRTPMENKKEKQFPPYVLIRPGTRLSM
jgi:hypothetical protein